MKAKKKKKNGGWLLENCKIVEENSNVLKIEICLEEYKYLLDDITKKSLIKVVNRRKVGFSGNIFFYNHNLQIMTTFVICHTANRLKHIALKENHYQLFNTCLDKIYKIKKIQDVFNTYKNLKEGLEAFLNSGFNNFWLYDYSQKFSYRKRKTFVSLKNYINENYYNICDYDP